MRAPTRARVLSIASSLAVAVLLVACESGGDGGGEGGGERGGEGASLSLDDLRAAGPACPVHLEAAVADAGLQADGDLEVDVSEGSGEGGRGDPPIDRLGGVVVMCSLSVRADPGDDSSVQASLFATRGPGVYQMYAALIFEERESTSTREELLDPSVAAEALDEIPDRIDRTEEGELVDLGFDAPIAVARIAVDGAQEAALLVEGRGTVSAGQTRSVAEELLASS